MKKQLTGMYNCTIKTNYDVITKLHIENQTSALENVFDATE